MTEYMKEVIEWMWGSKSKHFKPEALYSPEAVEFRKKRKEVFERCAPFITDEDFEEGLGYIARNHGSCSAMGCVSFKERYILPAREKLKKEKKEN